MPPMKRPSSTRRPAAAKVPKGEGKAKGKAKAKAKAVSPPPGSVRLAGEGAKLARNKHDQEWPGNKRLTF